MQKKNAGIARSFALKGLLLLAALTLSTGFFACKVAVGGEEEAPQVTLTFDAGEGSFKEGKTLTLTGKAGEAFTLTESPERVGYSFKEWNPALPEKYPEINTKYTAVWVTEGDYTITYELNGGTNAEENPVSYNVETETITLKDPAKPGYTFEGWYMAEDFTGNAVTEIVQGTTGNITLYAKWVKEGDYTITYVNVDGATNENPPSYNVETETITLKDPAKPGYTFEGWYMAEDFTGDAVTEITQGSTGDITLYAKWELESYTITYELDGGTNAPENPAGYNVETETITLKDPVKTGYTFAGWYSADNSPVTEITQGSTGDMTLYAKWELKNLVPKTLKVEGGSCTLNGTEVTLSSFWISPYEVTQEEFESLMAGNTNGIESNPSYFQGDTKPPAEGEVQERRPVEGVSWYDAIVYCNLLSIKEGLTPCYTIKSSTDPAAWGTSPTSNDADWDGITCDFSANGYRLPTEAEWEYAARGGQTGITDNSWNNAYSGSNTLDDVAWYYDNSDRIHEVGKKQANALGLYDMSGNVYEWCWDWYDGSGYPSGTEDPAGPVTGSYRVRRGGSWDGFASFCSVSYRYPSYPCKRNNIIGFRLVRSAR